MTTSRLVRPRPDGRGAPLLDAGQRRVVDHPGGPLLVLAGPGTGKTTTLVETVVERVRRGLAPEQVLLLTFSRGAAHQLRERVTARLGRTTRGPIAMTIHAYAWALLRREQAGPPVRLLTGAEQDLEIGRLLRGELEDGAHRWPADLRPALGLTGFRAELRDLLLRAQERGLGGADLASLGRRLDLPAWVAAGGFLDDYEARFDLDPQHEVIDQAGLVVAAAALLEQDGPLRERERAAYGVVLVDEYQDTDPAQVRLLQALAGDGRDLVAVGDPDQSIYGFRGADVRGILEFHEHFPPGPGGGSPTTVELRTSRRAGTALLAASRAVAGRLPAGGLGRAFRDLVPDPASVPGDGSVEVLLTSSTTAEAAVVADVLRRAHLVDGLAWSEMAVLLRSTPRSSAGLRRGLLAAGVPVSVPVEEMPLAEEPVVTALLGLLSLALDPGSATEQDVLALITGPLVGADALAVRRLRRALREVSSTSPDVPDGAQGVSVSPKEVSGDPPVGARAPGPAVGTDVERLLLAAVADPAAAPGARARPALAPLLRLAGLLQAARAVDGTAEQVLWAVWQRSGLADRWEQESLAGGPRGARADRAIDAVVALFEAAERFVDRLPHLSALQLVADVRAQQVPGDGGSSRTPQNGTVRLLTAHAAKGLEWRLVVVAGVQEGVWPDLRLRGSLLATERLDEALEGSLQGAWSPGGVDRRAGLLVEERRLFYVAVTRARERLVVTAVDGGEGDDDRPSRFLAELGVDLPSVTSAVSRPLTATGILSELRRVAADHEDGALREAACRRIARLAAGRDAPVHPAAHPDAWWGVTGLSDDAPLVAPGELVTVSPSAVESFDTCSLRWFLQSAVGIARDSGPAQVVGSVVHALCELASGPDALDTTQVTARLDDVWPRLDLGAPWTARRRRQEGLSYFAKFIAWAAANPRELVGTELALSVPLGDDVELRGRVDRLERDAQGRAVVVDLKTGSKPKDEEVARHAQLGVYQLAVQLGAFVDQQLEETGGASLLQLKQTRKAMEQTQVALTEDVDPTWARATVERVVAGMRGSSFPPVVNQHCKTCPVQVCCPLWPRGEGLLG